ncbi:hypothetical protein [Vibrio crassostreae]|uniref:hypothetical protein n=1 Tax=Vibrio crassostreae TaxID=246167 RepID=UPI000635FD17|nr:hypothetical protein [Vibrio crassostreae]TCN96137.1 hypothetical protein EDB30_11829 [Vibrio crassostreae]CAK1815402.1 conserved hypothetical protein [Vibrio crassostreae]CAK1816408.1 conserved hypothetical protein [Vibrio crassostreae]CAK1817001.1 conserved hypothetical protein [Vibrio crassostreae]CAK1998501.1 conserved hypothetical protein [Vibrio crassostreae]
MITSKQAVAALEQLRVVLGLSADVDVLEELNIASKTEWVRLDNYPNYEQNQRTKAVRNIGTRRVLKHDSNGYVKCRSRLGKWSNIKAKP